MSNHPEFCIFCGSKPLSKEHIWPDWIKNIVARGTENRHAQILTTARIPDGKTATIYTDLKSKQGPIGASKVKVVCHTCNNGWMSLIEEDAKNVLTSLLLGESVQLGLEEQIILAKWGTLKSMVAEFTDLPTRAIPSSQNREFIKSKIPPSDWKIWVARYYGSQWAQRYYHVGATLVGVDTLNRPETKSTKPNTQFSIFSIGCFLMYTFKSPFLGFEYDFDQRIAQKMNSIYPYRLTKTIDWGTVPILNDMEANILKDNFLHSLRTG